jgi:L-iditol 2-dehydrogenase
MNSTMSTAQVARLYGPGDIRVEAAELVTPRAHEVVVEMRSGGICGSDMHYFSEGRNGQNILLRPAVLGHEAAGVVARAGTGTTIEVGTPVVVEPSLPCRQCRLCRTGRYNVCPDSRCFGSPPTDGLFATHAVVPEVNLHPLPARVPAGIGAVIEPLAVAVWAVERAGVSRGEQVLVIGAGPIGVLVARIAALRGAREVTVSEIDPVRRDVAGALGIGQIVDPSTDEPGGHDHVIECSGATDALLSALTSARPAGRVTIVGQARPSIDAVPFSHLQRYEIDVVTAFRYAHAFPTAISHVEQGRIEIEDIITARLPLARIGHALASTARDPHQLKVLVTY